jgi:hypothetical protein
MTRKYGKAAGESVERAMREFGLESFVKTSGGKGLHVVVPMMHAYSWKTVKAFARAIAESMEHDNSKRYIARANKAARKGKIFVDYLRNDLTAYRSRGFFCPRPRRCPGGDAAALGSIEAQFAASILHHQNRAAIFAEAEKRSLGRIFHRASEDSRPASART